jgi:hypothetical protein
MLLAGRTAAQQATTLRHYSANFEAMPRCSPPRCRAAPRAGTRPSSSSASILLTTELGKERAARGEHALLDGVAKGNLDLITIASVWATERFPEMPVLDVPFMFRDYPA